MNKLRKLQHEFQNYLLGDDNEQIIIKQVECEQEIGIKYKTSISLHS